MELEVPAGTEQQAEGDQLADDIKKLDIEDKQLFEEQLDDGDDSLAMGTDRSPTVSMRNMHFTNGDWYPEEKRKVEMPPETTAENPAQSEESGDNLSGAEAKKLSDDDELDSDVETDSDEVWAKYADEETGEVPMSFFEILCRECSKIPYTPEEQQERRNSGHRERNKMLLDGVKTNHREWVYQLEEKLALELMNERRKARKKALKEERKRAESAMAVSC